MPPSSALPAPRYRIAGLTWESDLPLPGVSTPQGPAEVSIRAGSVPAFLPEATAQGPTFQAQGPGILLTIPGAARFLIDHGRIVTYDAAPHVTAPEIALFLLGPVLGALCLQRGLLALNASAVAVGATCVAFAGPPGSGKSVLAAALAARGHRVVADGLLVLSPADNGAVLAWPTLPRLTLWADALAPLGLSAALPPIRPGLNRHVLDISPTVDPAPLPLASLCLLRELREPTTILHPLPGVLGQAALVAALAQPAWRRALGLGVPGWVAALPAHVLARKIDFALLPATAEGVARHFSPGAAS